MDIIYSRRKLRINKRKRIVILIFLLVLLFSIFFKYVVYPIFIGTCEYKAKTLAIQVTNDEINKVMEKYSYHDLIDIQTDDNGNVTFIESNVVIMNKIISEITKNIQDEFTDGEDDNISINLGAFTGTKIFSGVGPKVKINIVSAGNIETNVKSEFFSVGVNQSIHRIYLQINSEVTISTPVSSIQSKISTQALLGETIIVGNIPNTYYELDNLNRSQMVDIIE